MRPSGDGSTLEGSAGQWMKARQRTAFPPNYIHSIDSTHMMMTALECSRLGEWEALLVLFVWDAAARGQGKLL